AIANEIEQFEEAGALESGKAVFEVISPVSGKIVAVNEQLMEKPELLNENPYEQGWIAEIELTDFAADKELLHTFAGYFTALKRKVDDFHV
ncbi:MAG: glycine cleavage system protein H, partial [Firmicutes bacterium]|nr:glycine cleavage system protein H [Bacillota bacterium]